MKVLLIIIFSLTAFLQETGCQTYKFISLHEKPYTGDKKLSFNNFEVIDARQDSGKVGYISLSNSFLYKVNFKNGLSSDIRYFLNTYYKTSFSDSNYSVLLVIKKLWISQFDTTLLLGNNQIKSGKIDIEKIKIEFYLRTENNYYPILRMDSSFITTQQNSVAAFGGEIADGITSCCDRLFSLDISQVLRKKKITFARIEEFNNQLLDRPVLHTSEYKKGVYMTFDEFLKNQPSRTYRDINQQKFGDVLFLEDKNGEDYASNKFWGYSDGKEIYVTSGKNFFQLKRVQNTFEFFGIKNLRERFNLGSSRNSSGEGPAILHKRKPAMDLFFYQLDMETGEVY